MANTRKIRACGKYDKVNRALSNYMYCDGLVKSRQELVNTISGQPFNAERICRALNNNPHRLWIFKPYKANKNEIIITATDCFGNEDYIYIEK